MALVRLNPSQRDQRDRTYANTDNPAINLNLKLKSTSWVDKRPVVKTIEVTIIF